MWTEEMFERKRESNRLGDSCNIEYFIFGYQYYLLIWNSNSQCKSCFLCGKDVLYDATFACCTEFQLLKELC